MLNNQIINSAADVKNLVHRAVLWSSVNAAAEYGVIKNIGASVNNETGVAIRRIVRAAVRAMLGDDELVGLDGYGLSLRMSSPEQINLWRLLRVCVNEELSYRDLAAIKMKGLGNVSVVYPDGELRQVSVDALLREVRGAGLRAGQSFEIRLDMSLASVRRRTPAQLADVVRDQMRVLVEVLDKLYLLAAIFPDVEAFIRDTPVENGIPSEEAVAQFNTVLEGLGPILTEENMDFRLTRDMYMAESITVNYPGDWRARRDALIASRTSQDVSEAPVEGAVGAETAQVSTGNTGPSDDIRRREAEALISRIEGSFVSGQRDMAEQAIPAVPTDRDE